MRGYMTCWTKIYAKLRILVLFENVDVFENKVLELSTTLKIIVDIFIMPRANLAKTATKIGALFVRPTLNWAQAIARG